jgi:hypothetical protein
MSRPGRPPLICNALRLYQFTTHIACMADISGLSKNLLAVMRHLSSSKIRSTRHISHGRRSALRTLLKPRGRMAVSFRQIEPGNPRSMFPCHLDELEQLARIHGTFTQRIETASDELLALKSSGRE